MIIFYTPAAEHFAAGIDLPHGASTIKRFADGELNYIIDQDVSNQQIWVIATTTSCSDSYFELFFLLDALARCGATINLVITYLGYARQDRATQPRQAVGGAIIATMLKQFNLASLHIIHAHNVKLQRIVPFEQHIPYKLFYPIVAQADIIVAPDQGAQECAQTLGNQCNKPVTYFEKMRTNGQITNLTLHGDVAGKTVVLLDDMINTGQTITQASMILKDSGAQEIVAVATHGIFAGDALEKIEQSTISKVYVTNSVEQKVASKKVEVVGIETEITRIIKNF